MRNLSTKMIGLLVGAAMLTPIAAQAQEQGRERGGWQRGGGGDGAGRASGWQRGAGETGGGRAMGSDGNARRQAWEQRSAAATAERAARVDTNMTANRDAARQRRGDREANRTFDNASAAETRRRWVDARTGGARAVDTDRTYDRNRADRNRDRVAGVNNDRRDRDRNDRNDRGWNRDGRNDRDGNRSWTTDRRNWDRGDRNDRNDRWDRNWRNDRRYSWQDYRSRNRGHYRLPRYVAPRYGYSYQRWYPGHRFDSFFYSSTYWISDPWSYRLPPADGGYRWVRYYDDAVLVDIDTGEIVDIIYSFFF